jgi:hypothetical protein
MSSSQREWLCDGDEDVAAPFQTWAFSRCLTRLVHWLLVLPEEEELEFRKDVVQGFRGVGIVSIGPSELEFGQCL